MIESLYSKYPVMFSEKSLSSADSCMHWGVQCGNGWYQLLDILFGEITGYLKYNIQCAPVILTEVKEKFGSLRVRYRGGDANIKGMVDMAIKMSSTICEVCGTNQDVIRDEFHQTICNKCLKGK